MLKTEDKNWYAYYRLGFLQMEKKDDSLTEKIKEHLQKVE